MDSGGDLEMTEPVFGPAPESELASTNKVGRPRDTRYDGIVRQAYESGIPYKTVIDLDDEILDDVVRGIKRGAKHVGVSVSYTAKEEEGKYVIEFIAYETGTRGGESS